MDHSLPVHHTAGLFATYCVQLDMERLRIAVERLPKPVSADLLKTNDEYRLLIDVPGAHPSSTNVRANGRWLSVTVDRSRPVPNGAHPHHQGREESLELDLPLPSDIDSTAATATLERGVLQLDLPRETEDETSISIE